MTPPPRYSQYHPRWHRTRMPIFWWVHKWSYVRFIVRELTSIIVALYAVFLLVLIRALAQGPEAYANIMAWLRTPLSIVLHVLALALVIFHSITWFNLAPKALSLRLGNQRVPDAAIAAANFVAWAIVSVVIAWIVIAA